MTTSKDQHEIISAEQLERAKDIFRRQLSGIAEAIGATLDETALGDIDMALESVVTAAVHAAQAELSAPASATLPSTGSLADTILFAEQRVRDLDAERDRLAEERDAFALFLDEMKGKVDLFRTKAGVSISDAAPTNGKSRKEETARTIPADWTPDEKQVTDLIAGTAFSEAEILRGVELFRAEKVATGETRTRWGAAFRHWLIAPGTLDKIRPPATAS